jgi:hypothetical protein
VRALVGPSAHLHPANKRRHRPHSFSSHVYINVRERALIVRADNIPTVCGAIFTHVLVLVGLAGRRLGLMKAAMRALHPKAQTQNHSPVSSTRNLSPRESSEIVPRGLDESENVIFAPAAAGFCVCA